MVTDGDEVVLDSYSNVSYQVTEQLKVDDSTQRREILNDTNNGEFFISSLFIGDDGLHSAIQWLAVCILLEIAFITGLNIKYESLKDHFCQPTALLLSATIHFLFMPLLVFAWVKILAMSYKIIIVVLATISLPGGVGSSGLLLLARGDLSLNSCMEVLFTLLSFAILPFNLYVFTSHWLLGIREIENAIAYPSLLFAFLLMTIPISIGGIIVKMTTNVADKLAVVLQALLLLTSLSFATLLAIVYRKEVFVFMTPTLWIICGITPIFGFALGFLSASMFHLVNITRRTVAIETMSQNGPFAGAILRLIFPEDYLGIYSIFPIIYSLIQFFEALIFVAIVRYQLKKEEDEKENAFFALGGVPVGRIRRISFHAIDKIRKSFVRSKSSEASNPTLETQQIDEKDKKTSSCRRGNVIKMAINEEEEGSASSKKIKTTKGTKMKRKPKVRPNSVSSGGRSDLSKFEDVDISKSDP